ncbi:hypothetical protein WR25_27065 [Diploscapter pachys]|uniref:DNA mismatch repair protein MutS core domain-containing protein n=1 Tax=Diploscapter pachys TaxID=2018661 RepID=A0A2A2KCP2_9BILA|nr:hypothetical protein WR25_27065 [Diploscapter pachys]
MDELSARGEAETENIGDDEEEMVEVKKEKERSEAERTEAAEQRRAERAVDQEGEHIILAISYNGGHFGAAVYDQLTATIQLLRDCSESSDFRLIESLIVQTRPTVILACRSQDLNLLRWLARNFSDESVDLNGTYAMGEDSTLPSERTNEFITTGETGRGEGDDHNAGQPDADEIGEESGERLDPAAFNRSCSLRANDENGEEGMEVEREEHGQNGEDDEADDIDDDQQWSKPKLVTIVSSSYKYEKAVQRIKELFESEESSDKLQTLTRFRIDLESRNMVRAFGALLRYMDATRIGVQNEPLTVRSPVRVVKTLVLEELMEIDRNTFLALDIFAPTRRQEAGYRSILAGELKKNATLFGLVNRCKSTPGRAMLRHWFEHPILNREILRKRQRAVSFFTHDCYADITSNIFSRA